MSRAQLGSQPCRSSRKVRKAPRFCLSPQSETSRHTHMPAGRSLRASHPKHLDDSYLLEEEPRLSRHSREEEVMCPECPTCPGVQAQSRAPTHLPTRHARPTLSCLSCHRSPARGGLSIQHLTQPSQVRCPGPATSEPVPELCCHAASFVASCAPLLALPFFLASS